MTSVPSRDLDEEEQKNLRLAILLEMQVKLSVVSAGKGGVILRNVVQMMFAQFLAITGSGIVMNWLIMFLAQNSNLHDRWITERQNLQLSRRISEQDQGEGRGDLRGQVADTFLEEYLVSEEAPNIF